MACSGKSLRQMVSYWLAPAAAMRVRVTEFRHGRSTRECYVRVETMRPEGPVALLFFHHPDGSWGVFPPARERPAMRCY
nr:hypothetical protein [Paraburkholderia aromaticivorans]